MHKYVVFYCVYGSGLGHYHAFSVVERKEKMGVSEIAEIQFELHKENEYKSINITGVLEV
jgi:hypothetical protein